MRRFALLAFCLCLLQVLASCDLLVGKSLPLPADWPLEPFKIASTIKVVAVDDEPDSKHWAVWMNSKQHGTGPESVFAQELEREGYHATPRLAADHRSYIFTMISPDNQYYALLARGDDGSYPSPTNHKAQFVFEIVAVTTHRLRLGL